MARSALAAIVAGAFLGLVVILQLVATIGEPRQPHNFGFQTLRKERTDDTIFLLGAGKADITG